MRRQRQSDPHRCDPTPIAGGAQCAGTELTLSDSTSGLGFRLGLEEIPAEQRVAREGNPEGIGAKRGEKRQPGSLSQTMPGGPPLSRIESSVDADRLPAHAGRQGGHSSERTRFAPPCSTLPPGMSSGNHRSEMDDLFEFDPASGCHIHRQNVSYTRGEVLVLEERCF